jgi:NADPH oxidase 1
MEIQFRKPSFRYTPGQWIFINVPAVSQWQWHPFTITSAPADPYISIHIRQVGDFTKRLGQVLGTQAVAAGVESALANGRNMPTLRVDGPFGAPAEDVLDNEIAVLVGAGIGVTPWASVLKHILSQFKTAHPPQRLRRVEFIWYHNPFDSRLLICRIVPNIEAFEWFQNLLVNLENEVIRTPHDEKTGFYGSGSEFLRVHNYLTAKLDQSTVQNIMINDAGAMIDPLTGLKSRTHYGRPNWRAMFTGMREGIERGTYIRGLAGTKSKVGVYFCGPSPLAKALKRECNEASSEFVKCTFPCDLETVANCSYVVEGAFLRSYAGRSGDTFLFFNWSMGVLRFGDLAVIHGEMPVLTHSRP